MVLENYYCRNCGCECIITDAQRNFLEGYGCSQPPLFCDACFTAELSQVWEMPGERRVAVCSECGVETRLHFVPSLGRPVFCPQCHKKRQGA
ncbi:MAG TPA: zinc-binding protein [Candidatus Riflebacteria bacterium]|jgi:CxxC-x17-CxxC domain-containing protein|nr:zinc-binding protein [Candidatus Riflebacteria bacterium]